MKIAFCLMLSFAVIIFIFLPQKVTAIGFCTSSSAYVTCCGGTSICDDYNGNDQLCRSGGTVPTGSSCPY